MEEAGRSTTRGQRTRRQGLAVAAGAATTGAAALAACGDASGQRPAASAAPATVTFSTDWNSGARDAIMKQALAMFAQRYPTISVSRTDLGGSNVREKFAAGFAAGTYDDVYLANAPEFPYYRDAGAYVDLAPYLKAAKIDPKVFTYLDPSDFVGSKLFCLPFQSVGSVWYVNKTLFQKEGVPLPTESWTWNDLADA